MMEMFYILFHVVIIGVNKTVKIQLNTQDLVLFDNIPS